MEDSFGLSDPIKYRINYYSSISEHNGQGVWKRWNSYFECEVERKAEAEKYPFRMITLEYQYPEFE